MKQALKKTALACACVGGMAASLQAEAANWLMLQGTEPTMAAGRAKVWGFIQAGYKKDRSDPNASDQYVPPKLIGPNLTSQSGFNINRARIGVRGQGFPLDGKVNYFFLAEFGNNAITEPGHDFAKITDASITLNHIPGARVRVGLFKTPGSEEIYQGIALFDYIEFTNYTNQQLLERIPNAHYLYWSSELIFAGKGPRVQSLKLFAWNQNGTRLLDNTDDGTYNPEKFDRKRSGVGFKYLKKPYRVSGEYSKADGMIWVGPHAPTFDMNPAVPPGNGEDGKATGWYLDFGYYIPKTKWEVDFRYDAYTRLKDDDVLPGGPNAGKNFESVWKTKTFGVQYHFNLKTRLTINHIMRDVEAPDWGSGAGPNANLDGIGNRTAIQLTHIF
jgi:hypothetical protein